MMAGYSDEYYDSLYRKGVAALGQLEGLLPASTVDFARGLFEANEPGVAVETLSEALGEGDVAVTSSVRQQLVELAETMELD
jgi:hypothetical protein